MSTRYNDASHYENHQKAAELHDEAAHAHRVAEHHGKQEHETGSEQSRRAMERANQAFLAAQEMHREADHAHGITTFGHEDIAALAYQIWLDKGRPEGSADQDWYEAVAQLRQRAMHIHELHRSMDA